MDDKETIWIKKEETDEFVEDPFETSWSTDYIEEGPEVILEVDETKNIVLPSTSYESNSSRLIKNSDESCGISFEETVNQAVVHEELEEHTVESAHFSMYGTGINRLRSEEDSIFGIKLKCSLREKEFHTFTCSCCLQSFASKYGLIMHVFTHIDGVQPPIYVCKSCGDVFASNVSLNKHLERNEAHQPLSPSNNEKFDCSDGQEKIILVGDKEVLAMEETEKQFSSKETRKIKKKCLTNRYNTHTMAHVAEKRDSHDNYETSATVGNINDHTVLLTAKRINKCNVCGKSFSHLGHLKSHALIHTGMRQYTCDICGKSFTQSGTRNRHALTHAGERPYKCDICGKSFTQLGHFKNHSLIHTGTKPHKCDTCDKSFTELTTLKRHVLTHTGMKHHRCDTCGKAFALLGDLKRHTFTHTQVRPHTCDICGKSFIQSHHMKTHKLIHTKVV